MFDGYDRGVFTVDCTLELADVCARADAFLARRPSGKTVGATHIWYAAGDHPLPTPTADQIMQAETPADVPVGSGGWTICMVGGVSPKTYIDAGYGRGTFVECYLGDDPTHEPKLMLWQAAQDGWPQPFIPVFGGYDGQPLLRDVLPLLVEIDPGYRTNCFALYIGLDTLRPEDAVTLETWRR